MKILAIDKTFTPSAYNIVTYVSNSFVDNSIFDIYRSFALTKHKHNWRKSKKLQQIWLHWSIQVQIKLIL